MSSMQKILIEDELNEHFCSKGYVIADFIPPSILKELQLFYKKNSPENIEGFHTTHFSKNTEYKKIINDGILAILRPTIENILYDHVAIFANFMIKDGHGQNAMPLHADWTYVEEPHDISLSMWIPLVDTNIQNGCLGIIPYSQYLSSAIRGPRIIQSYPESEKKLINKMGKLLPLKSGQAIFYDHRLLHYSTPNSSNEPRPAINISIVPKNRNIIHYTCPIGEKLIHKYSVEDLSFYINYNNFEIPKLGIPSTYISPESIPTIDEKVNPFINTHSEHIINRIKKVFKFITN